VDSIEGLAGDEPFESLDPERELAEHRFSEPPAIPSSATAVGQLDPQHDAGAISCPHRPQTR